MIPVLSGTMRVVASGLGVHGPRLGASQASISGAAIWLAPCVMTGR